MTLYDELFLIHDSLTALELKRSIEEYYKQSVFSFSQVQNELDRLCEEGEFFFENGEYKLFVAHPLMPLNERTFSALRGAFLADNALT